MRIKRLLILSFITLLIGLITFEFCTVPILAFEKKTISNDDYIVYEGNCTAAYRMYARRTRIVVTNNSTYPMIGRLELVTQEDSTEVVLEATNDYPLAPYIINASHWDPGIENCPLRGTNTSQSVIIENWITENLHFGVTGIAYGDLDRNSTMLTFSYNYTVEDRINPLLLNNVTAKWAYRWDSTLGVLLDSTVDITNHNDSALNGRIAMILQYTSLWGISTDSVPGYPLEIILTVISVTIAGLFIIIRRRSRLGGD